MSLVDGQGVHEKYMVLLQSDARRIICHVTPVVITVCEQLCVEGMWIDHGQTIHTYNIASIETGHDTKVTYTVTEVYDTGTLVHSYVDCNLNSP